MYWMLNIVTGTTGGVSTKLLKWMTLIPPTIQENSFGVSGADPELHESLKRLGLKINLAAGPEDVTTRRSADTLQADKVTLLAVLNYTCQTHKLRLVCGHETQEGDYCYYLEKQ